MPRSEKTNRIHVQTDKNALGVDSERLAVYPGRWERGQG